VPHIYIYIYDISNLRVKEGILLRIFGPERDEARRTWRKLHGEIRNLYASSDIIWVIKPRRMKCVEYVVHILPCILNFIWKMLRFIK